MRQQQENVDRLDRWAEKMGWCTQYTDEARLDIAKSSGKLWDFDKCMNRLNKLKAEVEACLKDNPPPGEPGKKFWRDPLTRFWADMSTYMESHRQDSMTSAAVAEANWIRMWNLWEQHFNAWYEGLEASLTIDLNEPAFAFGEEELSEDNYGF